MSDIKIIDFMRLRTMATVLSILMLAASIGGLAFKGINWGLDFTGGTLIEVVYDHAVHTSDIRNQ